MNKKSLLVLIFLLLILPLAVLLMKQRQEIRKKAAANDIMIQMAKTAVSAGTEVNNNAINIVAGATAIKVATLDFTYDPAKVTVRNLRCGTELPDKPSDPIMESGHARIVCSKLEAGAVSNKTFAGALFDITVSQNVNDGAELIFTLTSANKLADLSQNILNGALYNGRIVVGGVPVSVFFPEYTIQVVGPLTGYIKANVSANFNVKSVTAKFTYSSDKVTVSNLRCGTDLPNRVGNPTISGGSAEITCTKTGTVGISNKDFEVALFDVSINSGIAWGTVLPFTLSPTTEVINDQSVLVTGKLVGASLTIGGAGATPRVTPTATPSGITVNPTCQAPGGSVTITGSNFGTLGRVIFTKNEGYCSFGNPPNYDCGPSAQIGTWTSSAIQLTVPAMPITDFGVFKLLIVPSGATNYITPIPTINVNTNCPTPPPTTAPTATPRITPTPTPTATVDPNRPASLTLSPALTTVGTSPVLIEINLNSGTKKVNSAQVIINVDQKLSVVDSSGNAVTEITSGNTALSSVVANSYNSSTKILRYQAGRQRTVAASTINGTLAKFYVKTAETSGTAMLSFDTSAGDLAGKSYVTDENSVNILGSAQALTLNLGSGCGQGNSITAGTLTTDSQGRYHVPLTLCANPAPALTIGGETAENLLKIIGGADNTNVNDLKSPLSDPENCASTLPTGGKVYCLTSFPANGAIDYIFNPGVSGARRLWVAFHNDANHTAASYWGIANSSWSNPVSTEVVNIPVSGNTFTFKLKFVNINTKPTTPNVTGLDYVHEKARVIIKSGDNELLKKDDVVLTAGDNGIYTSAPVNLGSLASGTYKLYVKPVGYFQKRFKDIAFPPGGMLDLTTGSYKFEAGDSNNDGVINLVDVNIVISAIQKQAAGTLTANDYNQSDYDRNGIINSGDTAAIFETMKIRYDDE